MEYKVYILWSALLEKYYVGSTQNLEDRFYRHNAGHEKFTSTGKPWVLVWNAVFRTRAEAVQLENKIKKRGIRRYLQDNGISFGK
ncbi:MAG: GIY-YIG nuclease family protein [Chitinophagaceae bacterium]|nr:MAG: GIY-YIG nuclease family protein [Chitinophagaceae bacterium]